MSRDFSFRAWDKDKNKMIYNIQRSDDAGWGFDCYQLYGERYEIMQYIGIKDKYENPVFESDIVFIGDDKVPFKVVYYENQASFNFVSLDKLGLCLLNFDNNNIEVLGNIYENPELLNDVLAKEKSIANKENRELKKISKELFGDN